jgi:hypothetical protein
VLPGRRLMRSACTRQLSYSSWPRQSPAPSSQQVHAAGGRCERGRPKASAQCSASRGQEPPVQARHYQRQPGDLAHHDFRCRAARSRAIRVGLRPGWLTNAHQPRPLPHPCPTQPLWTKPLTNAAPLVTADRNLGRSMPRLFNKCRLTVARPVDKSLTNDQEGRSPSPGTGP